MQDSCSPARWRCGLGANARASALGGVTPISAAGQPMFPPGRAGFTAARGSPPLHGRCCSAPLPGRWVFQVFHQVMIASHVTRLSARGRPRGCHLVGRLQSPPFLGTSDGDRLERSGGDPSQPDGVDDRGLRQWLTPTRPAAIAEPFVQISVHKPACLAAAHAGASK